MQRPDCPQADAMRARLSALCGQASALPDGFAELRAGLAALQADWDAQVATCSRGLDGEEGRAATPSSDQPRTEGLCRAGAPFCPLTNQVLLQTMVDHSHVQMAYLGVDLTLLAVNAAFARAVHREGAQLVGHNLLELYPHLASEAAFARVCGSGEPASFSARPFPSQGPELGTSYVDWTLVPIKGANGDTMGLVLSLSDVSQQELGRKALAESEHRYRLLVDTMAEGLATLAPDGTISYVNHEFCRMLRYSAEQLIGRHHLEVVDPREHARHRTEFSSRKRGLPGRFETSLLRSDGSAVPVIQAGRPVYDEHGLLIGTLAVFADISARREAELALARERDFVAAVLDTADALVVVTDTAGGITRYNRACEALTGYAFAEVRGRAFWDLFLVPDELQAVKDTFADLRAGHFPNRRENYWVTRSGERRLIAWSNTAMLDAQGRVQHIVSIGIDVTEARQAEQVVRSLARFPDENPSGVLRVSRDGILEYANSASQPLRELWLTEVGQALPRRWADLVAHALARHHPHSIETRCGDAIYLVDIVPIADAEYANIYARDITAQASAQAALRAARDGLEERVRARTVELEAANRTSEALSERERSQRLAAETLLRATMALNTSLDLDEVLDRILEEAQLASLAPLVALVPASEQMARYARQRGMRAGARDQSRLGAMVPIGMLYGADVAAGVLPHAPHIGGSLADESLRPPAGLEWVRSYLAVPLYAGDRLMGSLCTFSELEDAFAPEMMDLAQGFAAQAATAIRNAGLYAAESSARYLAESLAAASVALTNTLDLDAVLYTLLEHLQRLVPCDGASIALMRERDRLVVRAVRGSASLAAVNTSLDIESDTVLRRLLETRRSVAIDELDAAAEGACQACVDEATSWLGAPIVVGGQVIGVCQLCRVARDPFTTEQATAVEALVGQGGVAVQNAWLFGQVRAGQERLEALSRRLVEVQEAERRYIARELHDEAAQVLTSMRVGLSLLQRQAGPSATVGETVDGLQHSLDSVLDNLNRLTARLRPASLDHLGLDGALRQQVEAISQQHGIAAAYESLGLGERLAPEVETALYRIVQEALNNVVRHAQATQVDVLLQRRGDRLVIIVEDDGRGFDTLAADARPSLGLAGMRERADMLGGTVVIESSPGSGTTVRVEVPYGGASSDR